MTATKAARESDSVRVAHFHADKLFPKSLCARVRENGSGTEPPQEPPQEC